MEIKTGSSSAAVAPKDYFDNRSTSAILYAINRNNNCAKPTYFNDQMIRFGYTKIFLPTKTAQFIHLNRSISTIAANKLTSITETKWIYALNSTIMYGRQQLPTTPTRRRSKSKLSILPSVSNYIPLPSVIAKTSPNKIKRVRKRVIKNQSTNINLLADIILPTHHQNTTTIVSSLSNDNKNSDGRFQIFIDQVKQLEYQMANSIGGQPL